MEGFCEAGNGLVLVTVFCTPCFARGLPSLWGARGGCELPWRQHGAHLLGARIG